MSILSAAKSAAKSYIGNVVGGAKIVGSAVKNIASNIFSGPTQTASVISSIPTAGVNSPNQTLAPNQTLVPNMTVAPTATDPGGPGTVINGRATSINSGAYPGASPIYSVPTTIQSGQRPSGGGGGNLATTSLNPDVSGTSTQFEAGSVSTTPPAVSLPSKPGVSNPGTINNGGLVSALSDTHTYDPSSNTFGVTPPTPVTSEEQQRIDAQKRLDDMIPKKDNVYEDPAIKAQNEEVMQRKQEVANYTAQLNSVVAQQNADLLRLRGIGSAEGVTETVYGGQQATINREAAIKALPIQAQVAAAQGNLQLAQDYLTQLTTWKTEAINNDYNYKMALYSSISGFVKDEQKIKLDAKIKAADHAFELTKINIQTQDDIAKQAAKDNPALISQINALDPGSPTFRNQMANLIAKESANKAITDAATSIPVDSSSQSILSQTGLSIPAFAYLTQGTSALTRMTAAQRTQYMNEAANWTKTHNVDISTLQSQFSANNDVLKKNIERANQTQIFSGEVSGTVDQFVNDIGQDFGKLKVKNVAKLFAGEQVNDETVQKYAFDLHTMQNDLAGYYAASRGATSPDDADLKSAASVIQTGLNAGSAQAFQTALKANETKVIKVVNDAVSRSQDSIWSLFNVTRPNQTSADSGLVEKALNKSGLSYQDALSRIPEGEIGVVDKASGQVGHIPANEFDAAKYTKL